MDSKVSILALLALLVACSSDSSGPTMTSSGPNQAPTANAGVDQEVGTHAIVTLDGRGSSDPEHDALTYVWSQVAGPAVGALAGAQPSFTSPDSISTLVFQLAVTDTHGNASGQTTVTVYVLAHPGQSLWVATSGNDANAGTRASPLRTINAAIVKAGGSGAKDLYIGAGTYAERVILASGVSLYGGYDANWRRSATNITTIQSTTTVSGRLSAVEGISVTNLILDLLKIQTGSAAGTGVTNYGVYLNAATGLVLRAVTVQAGDGGPGAAGANGSAGANGGDGTLGANGTCDAGNGPGGAGGVVAGAPSGTAGGAGGAGGPEGANNGTPGATGAGGGGTGGAGGTGGDPGGTGGNGSAGAAGGGGTNGAGGSGFGLVGGLVVVGVGGNGANGVGGKGGGGGGGGGGQGCTFCNDGGGNGGGGGGAGGAAGTAGYGGTGGGGSFGIFLVNSTATLSLSSVASGNAGNGGAGGTGGNGGAGGAGARGASNCTGEIGAGGNGGAGGTGGRGGHGGGGSGGPSFAIYRSGSTLDPTGNALSHGTGGIGGASSGNAGVAGASANLF